MADFKTIGLEKESPNMYKIVSKFGGSDATPTLVGPSSTESDNLATLYVSERSRIVAGVSPAKLRNIPVAEILLHNDPNKSEGAWVVLEGLVYDVTSKPPIDINKKQT